ncbi:phage major tail protein, TP901-1 family [Fictibacillus sp. WQ 8-8]|uniref:phage major tail protein, TP901-1 family n=1 Tax=Fictibacillus sp. WQ 8-8 TaxID=2938788 RepID=UPI00210AADCA|nr:phage major tail protein, TP901-1 family [Fictibacillus sp. WQ 8-8]MCQ6267134.1 phage major tail protein, TP901-1 family [Fictibacillus sp. WQ 8-8]
MKMSGMKVKLFVMDVATGKLLAGQKNASLSRSAESIDATSKDTAGYWKESLQGFKSWSVDADGAFVESDEAYALLETAFLNSENVDIYLEFPSYDDLVDYSLSFEGNGALALVPAV